MNKQNGVYSNSDLVNSLIVDCNNAVGAIAKGEYVSWCKIMCDMVQKLACLGQGLKNEAQHHVEEVEALKEILKSAGMEISEITAEEFEKNSEAHDKQDEMLQNNP